MLEFRAPLERQAREDFVQEVLQISRDDDVESVELHANQGMDGILVLLRRHEDQCSVRQLDVEPGEFHIPAAWCELRTAQQSLTKTIPSVSTRRRGTEAQDVDSNRGAQFTCSGRRLCHPRRLEVLLYMLRPSNLILQCGDLFVHNGCGFCMYDTLDHILHELAMAWKPCGRTAASRTLR